MFSGYESTDGVNWTLISQVTISMNQSAMVGFGVTSKRPNIQITATFENVSLNTSDVTVPDVVGQTQSSAESALTSAGLAVGTVTTQAHASIPAGDVISQDPAGGTTAQPGTAVDLVVSLGANPATVPNVVGQSQSAAESAITAANLVVGSVTTQNDPSVPAGDVISQNPAGGSSVAEGSAVDLVVSLGPAPVTVPNVVGLSQAAAESAIVSANLVVGSVTTQNDPSVPAGDVISQNPAGGASAAVGSAVDLVVSLGPVTVTVPNVVGLDQTSAESSIVGANLVVGTVTTQSSATVPAGNVISQNPAGGSTAGEGSAVDLVVSLGPASIVVPDVVGQSQSAAEAAIMSASLIVGTVTTQSHPSVPAGDVISQNPVGGSNAAPGSAVDLVVSSGPASSVWQGEAIGDQGVSGSFVDGGSTMTIDASGANLWDDHDDFYFVYQPLNGDGEIIARVSDITGTHINANAGVMIRETLDDGSRYAMVSARASNRVDYLRRRNTDGNSQASSGSITGTPAWVRLERVGDVFSGYESTDGVNWTLISQVTISMNQSAMVGFGVTSKRPNIQITATFENVSLNTSDVTVPDVVGQTQSSAESALTSAGLAVGTVTTQAHASIPAGDVISQDPAGGTTAQPGTAVDLVVSLGANPATVPNVVGQSQSAAESAITAANLVVGSVTTQNDPSVPAGDVISQNPAGGSSVAEGSAVDLVVSLGPAPVTVPNVVGLSQAAAESAIVSANLVVGSVTTQNDPSVPAGDVISQNPAGGASAAVGSAVDLVVSLGPVTVTVPDVVGLDEASAGSIITGAGLVVGTVTTQSSATVPAGDVISQNPAGGSTAAEGSAVDLVVSLGPASIVVPDVVGLDQATAESTITGASLVVGTVTTQTHPTVPAGDVISQNPTGGSSAAPGSAVDLVVSTGPGSSAWQGEAIGDQGVSGSFVDGGSTVTIDASGASLWDDHDDFYYVYQPLNGDGEIIAQVSNVTGTHINANAGVMIRETLAEDSTYAMVSARASNRVDYLRRRVTGNRTQASSGSISGTPVWVRLVRAGDVFSGYESSDGVNWTLISQVTISMNQSAMIGFGVTSKRPNVQITATFDNVSLP